jgi:hypothetical protein
MAFEVIKVLFICRAFRYFLGCGLLLRCGGTMALQIWALGTAAIRLMGSLIHRITPPKVSPLFKGLLGILDRSGAAAPRRTSQPRDFTCRLRVGDVCNNGTTDLGYCCVTKSIYIVHYIERWTSHRVLWVLQVYLFNLTSSHSSHHHKRQRSVPPQLSSAWPPLPNVFRHASPSFQCI